ncbi:hypothetical protein LIER_21520 [Lithospermum erythrorhizon]|uniref:Replication factor A C-terminal domain-containing protein n=1 Tax=Lithospermum erythrorhizon TaxID=34254 RepID=A0AAV3QQN3_LITER
MGIMLKSKDSRHVNIDNEQTIVQNFEMAIQLTLWGELTSSVAPSLTAASKNHNVVMLKVRDAELPQLLDDESILTYRDTVCAGSIRTYSVVEIRNSTECRDYWISGFLQLHEEDQKLFYVGCSNCFLKINISDGIQYTCLLCKKEVVSRLRPIVIMSIENL